MPPFLAIRENVYWHLVFTFKPVLDQADSTPRLLLMLAWAHPPERFSHHKSILASFSSCISQRRGRRCSPPLTSLNDMGKIGVPTSRIEYW